MGSLISYWGVGEHLGYRNQYMLQCAYNRPYEYDKEEIFLFDCYSKITIIRSALSQKENSIHAIQDPSHYDFPKNNDRIIQSDDLNEDYEGTLLDLYEILVKCVKSII